MVMMNDAPETHRSTVKHSQQHSARPHIHIVPSPPRQLIPRKQDFGRFLGFSLSTCLLELALFVTPAESEVGLETILRPKS